MAGPQIPNKPALPKPGDSAARPATPKQVALPPRPPKPANAFQNQPPAAEPARRADEEDDFGLEIEIDENGDDLLSAPPRRSDAEMLAQVRKLLPFLAELERAVLGRGVLKADSALIEIKGSKVLLGSKEIGGSDGRTVRIWLNALGYDNRKLTQPALAVLESGFKTSGPLLQISLNNAASVCISAGFGGVFICMHKGQDSPASISFPARVQDTDKK